MADREWQRLIKDAYHSLEFTITMHSLRKYLPPHGHILDAGGGPGRYTIELCRAGYNVTLLDLSSGNLEIAKEQFASEPEGVQKCLHDMLIGNVCDLSRFPSGSFDAVICLGGVVSHIASESDRYQAVSELVRVAKPGALVGISVIGYLALLRDCMQYWSQELLLDSFPELIETGNITGPTGTPWHFYRADELRNLGESLGLETIEVVGCEGLSAGSENATNQLALDTGKWNIWLNLVIETAGIPAVADMAEHILYLGYAPMTTKNLSRQSHNRIERG